MYHPEDNFACMLEISDERLQVLKGAMLLGRPGFQESHNAIKLLSWKMGLKSEGIQLNPQYCHTSRVPLQFVLVRGDTPFPKQAHTSANVVLGPVVQKRINANPRLKVNQGVYFSPPKCCSALVLGKTLH